MYSCAAKRQLFPVTMHVEATFDLNVYFNQVSYS